MSIATIITYCTNDYRYFAKCLAEAQKFSNQILIITCDHFFNGEPEDPELLNQTYAEHPECTFIEMAYCNEHLYNKNINRTPLDNDWHDFWYSTTRYVSFFFLSSDIDYVLFLDSDEIIEGDTFLKWLQTNEYTQYNAIRWFQYYYFREAKYRSKLFQIGGLFAKKEVLKPSLLMNTDDRCGIFHTLPEPKKEGLAFKNEPFVHHYCWVKTKEECIRKASYLSEHWSKDWKTTVEKELSEPFKGFDFENRPYETIPNPYFDPLNISLSRQKISQTIFPNVQKVTPNDIQKKELIYEFDL